MGLQGREKVSNFFLENLSPANDGIDRLCLIVLFLMKTNSGYPRAAGILGKLPGEPKESPWL